MKTYSYRGNIITADSKEEAIQDVINKDEKSKVAINTLKYEVRDIPNTIHCVTKEGKIYRKSIDGKYLYPSSEYDPENPLDRHKPFFNLTGTDGKTHHHKINDVMDKVFPEVKTVKGKIIPGSDNKFSMTPDKKIWSVAFKPEYRKIESDRFWLNGKKVSVNKIYKELYTNLPSLNDIKELLDNSEIKSKISDNILKVVNEGTLLIIQNNDDYLFLNIDSPIIKTKTIKVALSNDKIIDIIDCIKSLLKFEKNLNNLMK